MVNKDVILSGHFDSDPTGRMALLRLRINVIDVDSRSQQRCMPSGMQSSDRASLYV